MMNARYGIPLFYFNPAVCFIDDDPHITAALTMIFTDSHICRAFNSSRDALTFLQAYQAPLANIQFTSSNDQDDSYYPERAASYLNIKAIADLSNISERGQEIAVLIIDQQMPELSGLELCKLIQHTPMKKILLTGDTRHEQAIEAFNDGLIDVFVDKGHKNLAQILEAHVKKLSYQYFLEKTMRLKIFMKNEKEKPLSSEVFYNFFNKYCIENNICEYYLIDKCGSFLMIDNNQQVSYLVIMSNKDIQEFIDLNIDSADIPTKNLLLQMEKHQLLPFFGVNKECWQVDMKQWRKFFYPATLLPGQEFFTYAIIKRPTLVVLEGGMS